MGRTGQSEESAALILSPSWSEDSQESTSFSKGSRLVGGRYAYACLGVFLCVFLINQADRQVVSVLIPSGLRCNDTDTNTTSHQDCLHFSDTQQGLLTGPAFAVVFTLSGIPISWVADRYNRMHVLRAGLLGWSLVMIVVFFVQQFWQLLLLQMLLGVGEASCNPTIYAMLSDLFLPSSRASALSVYNCGVYLGGGLGYLSGAINGSLGWRWTFLILGLPGFVLLAVLVLLFHDPRRGQSEVHAPANARLYSLEDHTKVHTVRESIVLLLLNRPFVLICLASSVRMFSGYALGAWLATFYERRFDLGSSQYGIIVGLIVIVAGSAGSLAGGYLSDRLMSFTPAAKAYVIAVSQLISAPFIAGVFLAPDSHSSFVLLFFAYLTGETWLGPAAAVVQDVMPAGIRALSIATYTTINTLIGGLGPLVVGALLGSSGLCTRQYGERHGVQYALLYLMPICYTVSAAGFVAVGGALHRRAALASGEHVALVTNAARE